MRTPRRHVTGPDPRPRWGRFEPGGEVFRVTSTDTPRPWTNLIANWTYGAFFTQHGMGYSFHVAPKVCEVTRWSLNESRPARFDATRFVWVRDLDSGRFWPGNPQPGEGALYRNYRCLVAPGWSEIVAERGGLEIRYRFFVPLTGSLELWTVTVTNLSKRARRLAIVPVVKLPTRGTYIRSRGAWNARLRAVRAFQPGDALWRRQDAHVFFGLDRPALGWDVSRDAFRGPRDDPRRPGALESGLARSSAEGEYMLAALETRARLRPGASFTFDAILGYAVRDAEAGAHLRRYRRPGAVEAAFAALRRDWKRKLGRARCGLPDADVARYLSVWGKHAVERTSQLSRGQRIGYRDQFQDLRAHLLADPGAVRGWLPRLFAFIGKDGSGVRGLDPLGLRHDLADIRDNPLWGVELVNAYVKETGDLAVLDEKMPWRGGGRDSLWRHLVRIATRLVPLRGRHGITLVAEGDWNDGLGRFGAKGRGESAWLQLLVVRSLRMLAELAVAAGRGAEARRYLAMRAKLARDFNRAAWDGAWYVYGWDDEGSPVGSRSSPEGKIHANVQTWALMEGVVPREREKKLWRAIDRHLWTDLGLVTCWPTYRRTQPTGAHMLEFAPGTYENASVYCHGTAFYAAACAARGRGDRALEAIAVTLPTNPRNPRCDVEPYGVTNFYRGPDSRHMGSAPHSWLTGSAAWMLFVGWEGVLGIQPDFDGLRVAPCVPRVWTRWSATREFRGARYEFVFRKPKGSAGSAVRRLAVDGKELGGNLVPVLGRGTHRVEVELGD